MAALIEAARAPDYPAEVVLVLSNREDAPGLAFARDQGLGPRPSGHSGLAATGRRMNVP